MRAVVDLCAELPAASAAQACGRYLALPVLDGCAPAPEQLSRGVRWIDDALEHGPVFVHCALGHGRSATLIVAWKLAHGVPGLPAAEAELRQLRPGVSLRPAQRAAVEAWARGRALPA